MRKYLFCSFVVLAAFASMAAMHCTGSSGRHKVVHVYDGDTIKLDDGRKVRLIGIDAPEVESPYSNAESFGEESKRYLAFLLRGKEVTIKPGWETCDRYGRTLAYVYADNVLVNGRMIRDGWARAYRRFDHEYRDLFIVYEKEAKARGIGIWNDQPAPALDQTRSEGRGEGAGTGDSGRRRTTAAQ